MFYLCFIINNLKLRKMKEYTVGMQLVVGYHDGDVSTPILKTEYTTVVADNEDNARTKARIEMGGAFSVYETWID